MTQFLSENPLVLFAMMCLCWPGIIPVILTAYIFTYYKIRTPFTPKQNPEV